MTSDSATLAQFLADVEGATVVLGGAGMSTESGIPDYRGPSGSLRKHTPMQYQAFLTDPQARHRYWARSYLGWPAMKAARPNRGHRALALLQNQAAVGTLITQNVDGLHARAAAELQNDSQVEAQLIELHGSLDRIVCLNCTALGSRARLDSALREANPAFAARVRQINPDGDVEISEDELDGFVMLDCVHCGSGPLKPDVVFFGETVPRPRVEQSFAALDQARALLVLGSSLHVMSGYRFVLHAAKRGLPVAIVNQGPTRGDHLATLRVDAPLGEVLAEVSLLLSGSSGLEASAAKRGA